VKCLARIVHKRHQSRNRAAASGDKTDVNNIGFAAKASRDSNDHLASFNYCQKEKQQVE
jgi:hypothetical protein